MEAVFHALNATLRGSEGHWCHVPSDGNTSRQKGNFESVSCLPNVDETQMQKCDRRSKLRLPGWTSVPEKPTSSRRRRPPAAACDLLT